MNAIIITHDSHERANVFLGDDLNELHTRALQWLLDETASYRPEGIEDHEWLDELQMKGWTVEDGDVR